MANAASDIARVLDRARRRQAGVVLATAAALGLAGALLALLGGTALLGAGWVSPAAARQVALALGSIAVVAALAWAAVALVRSAGTPLAVARRVGAAAPELRGDLVSSVELEEEREELRRSGSASVALLDEHLQRTALRASGLDLRRVVSTAPARRAGVALGGVAALHLAALGLAPLMMRAGWSGLLSRGAEPAVRRADPITGDIELTYLYPAYLRRETRTVSGTGGEISAPKGTEVRLRARADRDVERAELIVESARPSTPGPQGGPRARGERKAEAGQGEGKGKGPQGAAPGAGTLALEVKGARELSGRLLVEETGTYRFRFLKGRKAIAEGPATALTAEPDAFPEVRITAPAQEVEVDARARVHVEWTASDDVGLAELTLVLKPPAGEERRTKLKALAPARRASGAHDLELAPLRLAEGERLLYWLEVTDEDAVSGPKRAASATHTVKIFSEAEHHRAAYARARELWEGMVRLLGDRIELLSPGGDEGPAPRWTAELLTQAGALDQRTRALHVGLRDAAQLLRADKSSPRALPDALANVAASIKPLEANLTSLRVSMARFAQLPSTGRSSLVDRVAELDARLDRELEKDVLYLEELFDKGSADDLVRVAKDLAARRRELAGLLEEYRKAPSEAKKKELLAEVARLRARMDEMIRGMAELAKGIGDEHMNREALAEVAKANDAKGGLDEVEKLLAKGDVDGAMKALDAMGDAMQGMLAGLERTAGTPSAKNAALMKEMLAFKRRLEDVRGEQEAVARETEAVKGEYQKAVAERMAGLDEAAKKLEALAAEARKRLARSEKGVGIRSEDDFAQSRDRLADLEKALGAKDLDAALESVKRAIPFMQRLASGLDDEARLAERYPGLTGGGPRELREAQKHASSALGPARQVREELEKLFPDPKSVLGGREQEKMGELAKRQGELEKKAGELQGALGELAEKAPVFPPQASELLGNSQSHMQRAQGELQGKDPQRGLGEQRQALDELGRFQRGLDQMAKNARGGGKSGGFPFPFGEEGGGRQGEGLEASREKVEVPGADQYKPPEEFRRDLLEAMKQGAPEPYQGEVKRYYQELVQ